MNCRRFHSISPDSKATTFGSKLCWLCLLSVRREPRNANIFGTIFILQKIGDNKMEKQWYVPVKFLEYKLENCDSCALRATWECNHVINNRNIQNSPSIIPANTGKLIETIINNHLKATNKRRRLTKSQLELLIVRKHLLIGFVTHNLDSI